MPSYEVPAAVLSPKRRESERKAEASPNLRSQQSRNFQLVTDLQHQSSQTLRPKDIKLFSTFTFQVLQKQVIQSSSYFYLFFSSLFIYRKFVTRNFAKNARYSSHKFPLYYQRTSQSVLQAINVMRLFCV